MIDIPLLSILFRVPVDGLPIYLTWLSTAKDLFHAGFECWREVIEVKAIEDPFPSNKPMDFRTVMPVKGLGRISMILWGVYWTYLQKDNLDEDSRADFARRGAYLQFGNISNHKG